MPFISVKTNANLSKENITSLKTKLGDAISLFPGKSESWLMCEIEGNKSMFFKGSEENCAFVEVKLFGSVEEGASEKFTAEICNEMKKYGIDESRVYVRYQGGTDWGWNGSNF